MKPRGRGVAAALALLALACVAAAPRIRDTEEGATVTQYREGLLRLENGSSTARGSWTATVSAADAEQEFLDEEVIAFAPSGATGRFLSIDPVSRELRFFVTSATLPAVGDVATGGTSGDAAALLSVAADVDFLGSFSSLRPLLVEGYNDDDFVHLAPDGALQDRGNLNIIGTLTPWPGPTLHGVHYAVALDVSNQLQAILSTQQTAPPSAQLILPGAGDILLPQLLRWNARVLERTVNRLQVTAVSVSDVNAGGRGSGRLYVLDPTSAAARTVTVLSVASGGGGEVGRVLHFRNRNATHNFSIACDAGVQIDDSAATVVLAPGAARTLAQLASDRWYTLSAHP